MRTRNRLYTAVAGSAAAATLLTGGGGAMAQQPRTAEKIEVTGSNIKRTDSETPSVVQIITRQQIERSGATSVAELLREVPAIAGGSAVDFDGGTGFQRGNQTASLRGLGSVATLVLLNGRRIAPAPYADPNLGQGNSYNLNTIPISAIDRIEVLKDGASAIYGSDAIAGVVNVILKRDFRGGELSFSHWQKANPLSERRYQSQQLSGAVGFGDPSRDRYNVLFAAEYYSRDPQKLQDSGNGIRNDAYRALANRLNATSTLSFPANMRRETVANSGVFGTAGRLPIDPRCPAELRAQVTATIQECRWNTFDPLNIVSENERGGLMGRATFNLSRNLTAFAEASFSRTKAEFPANPPSLSAAAPSTWFNRSGQRFSYQLILPVGHPDNPNPFRVGLLYRFADLGKTTNNGTTDSTRAMVGLTGVFGAWDWETALLWNETERTETRNSTLHFPTLLAAVNNRTYRFNGNAPNSQALLDSLHPVLTDVGVSTARAWDLRGSRELWKIRGGPVMLATGVEIRREEMSIHSDPRTVAGEMLGLASSTVSGSRDIWSLYGELAIPVMRNLEVQLAGRYDHYSDFGSSTVPKLGVKWNATPTLAARATYARGFRAPSLFQISDANVQAFNSGIVDPVRCPGGQQAPGAEPEDCNRTISTLIQANTSLQPEKSTSNTFGVIFSPNNNFSLSADRWYVHRTDFIDRFDSATVIRNEFNPAFTGGTVIRDPNQATWLPGIPNSGPIQSTIRRFDNFGGTVARGYDLDAQAKLPPHRFGSVKVDYNGTYYDKLLWKLGKNVPYISGLGNFYVFESPRYRGSTTATWEHGGFTVLARHNYTGAWYYGEPTLASNTSLSGPQRCYLAATSLTLAYLGRCYVEAFETIDLGASWSGWRGLTLRFLVRNVANKAAPFDPNQTTLGFNPTFANPFGRYLQLSASYKF